MNICRKLLLAIVGCDGFLFALVRNDDFIDRRQALLLTRVVSYSSGDHYSLQNGRSVGAIESASRFDSAGEIAAKTKMIFYLMNVSCRTFSLDHTLIDYAVGSAIPIAHGNHNGGNEGGCDCVHRAAKSGGYCVAKTTAPLKNFAKGAPAPQ